MNKYIYVYACVCMHECVLAFMRVMYVHVLQTKSYSIGIAVSDTVSSCPMKAVTSDNSYYRHAGELRSCPSGTIFSNYACSCIIGPNCK